MSEDNEPSEVTGERFIPELMSGELIDAEHQSRYRFVLPHVRGLTVLDAGCGVGWGSALLLGAGARAVTGIDIDPGAVANASARVPEASFAVGDLLDLPLADESFDVVVCFEAVEHTGDTAATIDELTRVLAPGGRLFVSSPNPAVYPAGNPFHRNEETPEALLSAVAARLPHAQLFRQHLLIASVLAADGQRDLSQTASHTVATLQPGRDPYSLVVGSDREFAAPQSMAVFAPSHQLDALTALSGELGRLQRENDELRDGGERAARRMARLEQADRMRTEAVARAAEADQVRTERDSYAAMLLGSEQELAEVERSLAARGDELAERGRELADRARHLAERDQELARRSTELEVVYSSTSWRLTEPWRNMGERVRVLRSALRPGRRS